MYINELRMRGFKSFADATSLPLSKGLTVVVGPNGTGKSNVVDGLRFLSGESSARNVRGSELEDLIFSGTKDRLPLAKMEVEISVAGVERDRLAKIFADLNLSQESQRVELVRKLEKGKGSRYVLNGRDVLKRDVDIFLGDIAFGRDSLSIVGQGVVADIVGMGGAKRRQILEATAGLQGLRERYQDAGTRLQGVANNLEKLQEYTAVFATQIRELEEQAKKVRRYRNYGMQIRRIILYGLEQRIEEVEQKRSQLEITISESNTKEIALSRQILKKEKEIESQKTRLSDLRTTKEKKFAEEQEARFALRMLELKIEEAEKEKNLREKEKREILADIEREEKECVDASKHHETLTKTLLALKERQSNDENTNHKNEEADRLQENLREVEQAYESSYQELVLLRTQKEKSLEMISLSRKRLEEYTVQQQKAQEALEKTQKNLKELERELDLTQEQEYQAEQLAKEEERIERLKEEKNTCKEMLETSRIYFEREMATQQATLQNIRNERLHAEVEKNTLQQMWNDEVQSAHAIVKDIDVEEGYADALSAVWGKKILSGRFQIGKTSEGWREDWLADHLTIDCVEGVEPLAKFVDIPKFLHTSLAGVGVVKTAEEGFRRQHEIPRGGALVSKEGGIWRWDGYVRDVPKDSTRLKSSVLARKKRNEALSLQCDLLVQKEHKILKEVQEKKKSLQKKIDNEQQVLHNKEREIKKACQCRDEKEATLLDIKIALQQTKHAHERMSWENDQRQVALEEAKARFLEEQRICKEHEAFLQTIPDFEEKEQEVARRRDKRKELTIAFEKKNQEIRTWEREQAHTREQIALLSRDVQEEKRRKKHAEERLTRLLSRKNAFDKTYQDTAPEKKQKWQVERQNLIRLIDKKADLHHSAEQTLLQVEEEERKKQYELRELQEQRLHRRAEISAHSSQRHVLEEEWQKLSTEIKEKKSEHKTLRTADATKEQEQKWLETWQHKKSDELYLEQKRLENARERIGGVNLLAEQELVTKKREQEERVLQMQDIKEAADMLENSKRSLEKEAVKRFQNTFDEINTYFAENFCTVFGGGFANLILKNRDDTLNSDVEIEVQMPGKRVKHLSLLSGGEQSMVALCLLLAMFRTYPAPLYVLDEVDAALDDVNVGKFCTLLTQHIEAQQMRFLIVSHHRLTMASADTLFGVTMVEKGVSKLVSVDLVEALKNTDKN